MAHKENGPKLLDHCLIGYGIAAVVGSLITIPLPMESGHASTEAGFKLIASAGAIGAYIGYASAVKKRRKLGIESPSHEFRTFMGSGSGLLVAFLVLTWSLMLSSGVSFAIRSFVGPAPSEPGNGVNPTLVTN